MGLETKSVGEGSSSIDSIKKEPSDWAQRLKIGAIVLGIIAALAAIAAALAFGGFFIPAAIFIPLTIGAGSTGLASLSMGITSLFLQKKAVKQEKETPTDPVESDGEGVESDGEEEVDDALPQNDPILLREGMGAGGQPVEAEGDHEGEGDNDLRVVGDGNLHGLALGQLAAIPEEDGGNDPDPAAGGAQPLEVPVMVDGNLVQPAEVGEEGEEVAFDDPLEVEEEGEEVAFDDPLEVEEEGAGVAPPRGERIEDDRPHKRRRF